eukprot:3932411-Prorocentrum_lima.AAC.1
MCRAVPAGAQFGPGKRIDACPCLTASGERFHVLSLAHGLPGTPVRSKGSQQPNLVFTASGQIVVGG